MRHASRSQHDPITRVLIAFVYGILIAPWVALYATSDKFFLVLAVVYTAAGIALLPKAIRDWR